MKTFALLKVADDLEQVAGLWVVLVFVPAARHAASGRQSNISRIGFKIAEIYFAGFIRFSLSGKSALLHQALVLGEQRADLVVRQGGHGEAVAPGHGLVGDQRVDHRLVDYLDRGRE